jgi:uncharacterized protein YutE (UPF0331/DUF86 family)
MEQSDIQKLIQLRDFIIEKYHQMDGKDVSISVQPTKEVAMAYSSVIKSIEEILSNHINIAPSK